jgi:hypothetical protein
MGAGAAIATGLGAATQLGQGISSKQAGQRAAATGERQLGENEQFAQQIGQGAMGGFGSAMSGLQGMVGQTPDLNSFDIGGVANTQQMAIDNALGFGDRARATAKEQMGLGFNQQSDALDAALASRGLSRNSGVAAGALTGLLGQQGQQMAELNRGLADQQGNMALQAGQFDAQNALGMGQLGVQQTLGLNQQGIDVFNSQAGVLGSLGQLGMGGLNSVFANQQANLARTGQAASSAGAGKGAGVGGAGAGLMQNAGNFTTGGKGTTPGLQDIF